MSNPGTLHQAPKGPVVLLQFREHRAWAPVLGSPTKPMLRVLGALFCSRAPVPLTDACSASQVSGDGTCEGPLLEGVNSYTIEASNL